MPQHSQRQSCRGKFAELDEDEYEKNKTTSNFFIYSFVLHSYKVLLKQKNIKSNSNLMDSKMLYAVSVYSSRFFFIFL